jgi:hypothetical protein
MEARGRPDLLCHDAGVHGLPLLRAGPSHPASRTNRGTRR